MKAMDTLTDQIINTAHTYHHHVPMYIEYPHKGFWDSDIGEEVVKQKWKKLKAAPSPFLLYVHLPFCERQCFYCTCHTEITRDYSRIQRYLTWLFKEIDLYHHYFESRGIEPEFVEIHLGGGSPTLLKPPEFDALITKLDTLVSLTQLREFAIEIDPRHTSQSQLRYYHDKGINRISLGIQDFDPAVQQAINRIQPPAMIESFLTGQVRDLFAHGINFDILCGLPHQTPQSIRQTFETIAHMAPDRICLNNLHVNPEFAPHQRFMYDGKQGRPKRLPNNCERKRLFQEAFQVLTDNGYRRTGYDHFAKPDDDVARASTDKTMRWNALGVTAGAYSNVLGIGPHSTTTLPGCYYQNVYGTQAHAQRLNAGHLPIYRGIVLNRDDHIRRDVIQTLRTFFSLEYASIETRHTIAMHDYFSQELKQLRDFCCDGLVELSEQGIEVTTLGKEFILHICHCFDAYGK